MHNPVAHNFQEQLEYSYEIGDEPSWEAFYGRIWVNIVGCHPISKQSKWQQWGVDRVIYTASGQQFLIDEKKRKQDYGDILLEQWSVWRGENATGNKVGWSLDPEKQCDYVAYAVPCAHKCYLLPFDLLRQTFKRNLLQWQRNYGVLSAQNDGYETVNVAVPWDELKRKLCEQMVRKFEY